MITSKTDIEDKMLTDEIIFGKKHSIKKDKKAKINKNERT